MVAPTGTQCLCVLLDIKKETQIKQHDIPKWEQNKFTAIHRNRGSADSQRLWVYVAFGAVVASFEY